MKNAANDWLQDAFFEEPEMDSVDGGSSCHVLLWHAVPPRWGHSSHAMCSYHGMFPAKLVHYFVQRYTQPGDLVLDPFSGRGTTTLQARVEGRRTISNDLSHLAFIRTKAKAGAPSWTSITHFVSELERAYRRRAQRDIDVPDDI